MGKSCVSWDRLFEVHASKWDSPLDWVWVLTGLVWKALCDCCYRAWELPVSLLSWAEASESCDTSFAPPPRFSEQLAEHLKYCWKEIDSIWIVKGPQ